MNRSSSSNLFISSIRQTEELAPRKPNRSKTNDLRVPVSTLKGLTLWSTHAIYWHLSCWLFVSWLNKYSRLRAVCSTYGSPYILHSVRKYTNEFILYRQGYCFAESKSLGVYSQESNLQHLTIKFSVETGKLLDLKCPKRVSKEPQ